MPGWWSKTAKPHSVLAANGPLNVPSARTTAAANAFSPACSQIAQGENTIAKDPTWSALGQTHTAARAARTSDFTYWGEQGSWGGEHETLVAEILKC